MMLFFQGYSEVKYIIYFFLSCPPIILNKPSSKSCCHNTSNGIPKLVITNDEAVAAHEYRHYYHY